VMRAQITAKLDILALFRRGQPANLNEVGDHASAYRLLQRTRTGGSND
jgi:hypothetical protein